MIDFVCTRCGYCCSNTQSVQADGYCYGLYLTPAETQWFAPEAVVPLFKVGNDVTAYQLRDNRCPNLTADNLCSIYDHRPLACRAFPVIANGIVQGDCTFVQRHFGELISETSLASEQAASDEQHHQRSPRPSAKWPLDLARWIPV